MVNDICLIELSVCEMSRLAFPANRYQMESYFSKFDAKSRGVERGSYANRIVRKMLSHRCES